MTDSSPPTPPSGPPAASTPPPESPYRTPEAEGVAGGPKTSGLAIAALILALIPIACINFVGVILGIVALVKISKQPKVLKGQGLAIAAIVVGVLWFVVGILAAIAIPNFIKYTARAKQSEAKSNLKGIYTAARASFAEQGRLGSSLEEIGWESYGGTRYTYYFGNSRAESDLAPAEILPASVEVYARPDSGEFLAAAVGNIDSDPTPDVWVITDDNELENVINDIDE